MAWTGSPGFPGFGSIFTVGDPLSALNGGLGGWVPGTTPAFLPQGIAMPLPKGSDFLLQTHFHPNGLAQTEKTVIGLYFGPAPARLMTQLQVPAFFGIRANIDIPAGETDYKVRGSFTLPADVDAVGVWAHAHYLGKEAKLTATLPSGEVRILLWIRQWEFNWQDQYLFQDLVPLPKGTRLDGELTYDNSAENYRNPNTPPKRVRWGENSTDEMGSLLLNVLPKQADDIALLQTSSIVYVLTPVPLVGNKPLFVSSGMVDGASAQPGAVTPGRSWCSTDRGWDPPRWPALRSAATGSWPPMRAAHRCCSTECPRRFCTRPAGRWRRWCRTRWMARRERRCRCATDRSRRIPWRCR